MVKVRKETDQADITDLGVGFHLPSFSAKTNINRPLHVPSEPATLCDNTPTIHSCRLQIDVQTMSRNEQPTRKWHVTLSFATSPRQRVDGGAHATARRCLDSPCGGLSPERIAHNIMIALLDCFNSSRLVTLRFAADQMTQLPTMPSQQTQMFGESTLRSVSKEEQGVYIR